MGLCAPGVGRLRREVDTLGRIRGVECVISANDPTVRGGTSTPTFIPSFVSDFISMCDVYVTPYLKEAQMTSGTLAYSSWLTMQQKKETDPDTCAYNDLALVKVAAADVSKVNPSIPFWGGPVGINTTGTAPGDTVYSYGNSSLRAGVSDVRQQGCRAEGRGGAERAEHRVDHHPRGDFAAVMAAGAVGDHEAGQVAVARRADGVLVGLAHAGLAGLRP